MKVGVAIMDIKPPMTKDQIVKASVISKKLGLYKTKAKINPIYISDNGSIDTVLLSYDYYESMYKRIVELEAKEEEEILSQRIERLNINPSDAVSWKDIRRTGK
jgi:PHD/YefM family antitoxin component YafN of YafNO toxin-antitoxin module